MKARSLLFSTALVVTTALVTTQVVSQESKQQQPPDMPPEMMEMMQKMTEAGTPGKQHRMLDRRVGKWNGTVKMWWAPDAEADQSACTSEVRWIMDGRFLVENVEGNFGGQTFNGMSWMGYDNVWGKYVSAWIDNMSTGIYFSEGSYDEANKTFKYSSECSCPMTGKRVSGRAVERWIDDNTYVVEMYGPYYKTGEEFKSMELTFKRAN